MKNIVREVRSDAGLTQAELAEQVQVSRQTIISVGTARYTPSAVLALKLARALNRRVEELFMLEDGD